MNVLFDGNMRGQYRITCGCGLVWHGRSMFHPPIGWSPAAPLAEVILHRAECHLHEPLEVNFTKRFEHWLAHYWMAANNFDRKTPSPT